MTLCKCGNEIKNHIDKCDTCYFNFCRENIKKCKDMTESIKKFKERFEVIKTSLIKVNENL
jgi:hypothetical protein